MSDLTNVVSFKVDGVTYDIDLFDIDGIEWRDAKQASGLLRDQVIQQAVAFKEFDAVAALVWIWRRREEPNIDYMELLRSLTLKSGFDPDVDGVTSEVDADPPA